MSDSVDLGEELEAVLAALVAKGSYASRQDALREGVRLLQVREDEFARLDAEMLKGIESVNRGELIPLDDAFDQLNDHIRELGRKSAA